MRNFFVLVWLNQKDVFSAKPRSNPSSIHFFPAKYPLFFWKHVLSWLRDNNIIVENLKEEDIIFGKFDVGDDFLLVNHILLLGKYYIYSQKCQKGMPSLQGFIARTRRVYNIELYIARKRGTLNKHLSKWEKLINIM